MNEGTTQDVLTEILARLDAIEKRLNAMPNEDEMIGLLSTTASDPQATEIQQGIDGLYELLERQEQRETLAEIRASLKRPEAPPMKRRVS